MKIIEDDTAEKDDNEIAIETRKNGGGPVVWFIKEGENGMLHVSLNGDPITILPIAENHIVLRRDN